MRILCVFLAACVQNSFPTVAIRATTVVDVTDGSMRVDHTVGVAQQWRRAEGQQFIQAEPAARAG